MHDVSGGIMDMYYGTMKCFGWFCIKSWEGYSIMLGIMNGCVYKLWLCVSVKDGNEIS